MNEVTPTTAIAIYQNSEFGQIRTMTINGEPWFVGKDVAEILGYANQNRDIIRHVDEEDRMMVNHESQLNTETVSSLGQRGGWIINESGLYSLILSSKLPTAKQFKRWVTSEVLPAIRKTGGYGVANDRVLAEIAALRAELEATRKTALYAARSVAQPPDYRIQYNSIAPVLTNLQKLLGKESHKEVLSYIYDTMEQHGGFSRQFAMNRLKSKYPTYYVGDKTPSIINSIIEFPDYYAHFMKVAATIEKNCTAPVISESSAQTNADKISEAIAPLIAKRNDRSAHGIRTYSIVYGTMGTKASWSQLMRRCGARTKKEVILARPDKYELFCECIEKLMNEI